MNNPALQTNSTQSLPDQTGLVWMFRLGVFMLILGQLITFASSDGEIAWNAMTALIFTAGLRIRQESHRFLSALLIAFCVALCLAAELRDPPKYSFLVHEEKAAPK